MSGASDVIARFRLHRAGRDWRGDCPACAYRESFVLTVRDGQLLGWCASCQDRAAVRTLLANSAGWTPPETLPGRGDAEKRKAAQERALGLWRGSEPAAGTLADTYLSWRDLPGLGASPALRFRGDCHHPAGGRYPAMVAAVVDVSGFQVAVHRTYLMAPGRKAPVEPAKASLGPVWGGAIRLDADAPELVIGEGIETSASAGRLLHLPAWAALSAGNLATGLVLPKTVRAVVIAADADEAGERAAQAAASRWSAEGRRVRIARPDKPRMDFNDLLRERMGANHAA